MYMVRGARRHLPSSFSVERIDLGGRELLQRPRAQRWHHMTAQQLAIALERAAPYPSIAADIGALKCLSCIIDGEAVALDEHSGLPIFDRLRYGPREKPDVLLYAFDLLELDGRDLRGEPTEERKATLEKLLSKRVTPRKGQRRPPKAIQHVEHLDIDDGGLIFDHACALGCEGIVSKLKGSRYTSGRTRDWIKVKNPNAPWAKRLEDEDWDDRR